MNEAIRHYTNEFHARRDVSPYDAEVLFDGLITETDEEALTELLAAWATKGATEDELYRFASILRARMKRVDTKDLACVDIVGTGGSSEKTFNVSTAAAFVVAGAGVPVAKHGNRAATSTSGSADVLGHLGVEVDVSPEEAESNLHKHGICFMFAPRHHSLSPTLARARKRVKRATIFNCLGPLCNPAGVGHQVIGVWSRELVSKMANVLARLGTEKSWIVNGHDRLDEISLTGNSTLAEVTPIGTREFHVTAKDMGIAHFRNDLPRQCSPAESAAVIRDLIEGKLGESDAETLVLINSAAAIFVAGGAQDLFCACEMARKSISSGGARDKLGALQKK